MGKNLGSKGFVLHGNSGEWDVDGFAILGTSLHDGLWINGRNRTLRGPWSFKNGLFEGCKQAAVSVSNAAGVMILDNVIRRNNGADISLSENTGNLLVEVY